MHIEHGVLFLTPPGVTIMVRRNRESGGTGVFPQGSAFPMANDDKGDRFKGEMSPEDREAIRRRASELGGRLEAAAKGKPAAKPSSYAEQGQGLSLAFRFLTELVVGVVVGLGLGLVLDRQFGTAPWLLLLFLALGFTAGMVNMIRSAQREQKKHPVPANAKAVRDDEDDDGNGKT